MPTAAPSSDSKHRILRCEIRLRAKAGGALSTTQALAQVLPSGFAEALSGMLEELERERPLHVRLERLEVNLGPLKASDPPEVFYDRLRTELRRELEQAAGSLTSTPAPFQTSGNLLPLRFLADATLPWPLEDLDSEAWERSFRDSPEGRTIGDDSIRSQIERHPRAFARLVAQFDDARVAEWVVGLYGGSATTRNTASRWATTLARSAVSGFQAGQLRIWFWSAVRRALETTANSQGIDFPWTSVLEEFAHESAIPLIEWAHALGSGAPASNPDNTLFLAILGALPATDRALLEREISAPTETIPPHPLLTPPAPPPPAVHPPASPHQDLQIPAELSLPAETGPSSRLPAADVPPTRPLPRTDTPAETPSDSTRPSQSVPLEPSVSDASPETRRATFREATPPSQSPALPAPLPSAATDPASYPSILTAADPSLPAETGTSSRLSTTDVPTTRPLPRIGSPAETPSDSTRPSLSAPLEPSVSEASPETRRATFRESTPPSQSPARPAPLPSPATDPASYPSILTPADPSLPAETGPSSRLSTADVPPTRPLPRIGSPAETPSDSTRPPQSVPLEPSVSDASPEIRRATLRETTPPSQSPARPAPPPSAVNEPAFPHQDLLTPADLSLPAETGPSSRLPAADVPPTRPLPRTDSPAETPSDSTRPHQSAPLEPSVSDASPETRRATLGEITPPSQQPSPPAPTPPAANEPTSSHGDLLTPVEPSLSAPEWVLNAIPDPRREGMPSSLAHSQTSPPGPPSPSFSSQPAESPTPTRPNPPAALPPARTDTDTGDPSLDRLPMEERYRRFHEMLERSSRQSVERLAQTPPIQTPPPDERCLPRVTNAGLVLVAPFLGHLFRHLGYLDSAGDFPMADRLRAVHLIQFIATGEQGFPEHELALNKLLCGVDPTFPVPLRVDLVDAEMKEAEEMIRSALHPWTPLRNTSIPGFRQSFLQRLGFLSASPLGPNLRVERMTLDVLLESIPWSFRMLKFPWMPHLLTVEW